MIDALEPLPVDLSGLPKYLRRRLQWVDGSPVLFLDYGQEPLNNKLLRSAMLHGIFVQIGPTHLPRIKKLRSFNSAAVAQRFAQ